MQVGEEEEEDSDEDDDDNDGEEMEGPEVVVQDEGPRQTSAEQLAGVRSFRSASGCSPQFARHLRKDEDELKRGCWCAGSWRWHSGMRRTAAPPSSRWS